MEKRLRAHYKSLIATNRDKFAEDLATAVKQCDNQKTLMLLEIVQAAKCEPMLMAYRENEGETILHIAAKYHEDETIVSKLVELHPQMMTQAREESDNYSGQTALHIAITKGNAHAVEAMLIKAAASDLSDRILYTQAVGIRFINTVMMGEVPLSVAALKFDREMVDILLKYGAELHFRNSNGDTVFHSLIKYSAVYPEKIPAVLEMIDFLQQELLDKGTTDREISDSASLEYTHQYTFVWFIKNNDNFTPLQLAAKHGIVEVFQYIMNLKEVYCFLSTHDGLFDIKMYDITEIDSVANSRVTTLQRQRGSLLHHHHKVVPSKFEGVSRKTISGADSCLSCKVCSSDYPETESVLEMLFDNYYESKSAFRIIEFAPIRNLVKEKWKFYRWIYFVWMAIHIWFISTLTAYAVERTTLFYPANGTISEMKNANPTKYTFVIAFQWLSFVFGLIYSIISVLSMLPKLRRPHAVEYFLHNIGYSILLAGFSLCIIIDTFMTQVDQSHNSIPMILAIIMGWWYNIFFLRAFKLFGFFTEMIKRVIFGDFLRFSMVILFELFAFTAGMHILFQIDETASLSSETIRSEHDSFGSTMLIMFKLMVGLGDIETLTETRVPWLSVVLFITFVILTYILLFNALIAMMSQTCALVLEDRYPQWRIQQLSVILFLEDIFFQYCLNKVLPCPGEQKKVRGFDVISKQSKTENRFFLEIHSLQMEYATEEDKVVLDKQVPVMSPIFGTQPLNMSMSNTLHYYGYNATLQNSVRYPSTIRRSETLDRHSDENSIQGSESRKKSQKRLKKGLSVVEEEDSVGRDETTNQEQIKFVDPPEVIASDRSPQPSRSPKSKRRRYHSENLDYRSVKETLSPPAENVYASAPGNIGGTVGRKAVDIKEMKDTSN